MQKVSLLGFLIIALVSAKNIPLQLEIGVIQIDNLFPGKMQKQTVQFEQPFPQIPQVALSVQQLQNKEEYTFFSKITNITNQGFTIDILSASEQSLSYRYMAMIDDRVQINCLNFKVKEKVFVQFKKTYQKQPKAASFITGLRGSDNQLQLLQEITREGIHFTFQNANKTEIIGLCTVAGTQDSLSYSDKDLDIPQFSGLLGMNKNSQIGIEAQASVVCDNDQECAIYFQSKFENIENIQKNNITQPNVPQFPKIIRNWNESEILPQLQTNNKNSISGLTNIKQIIQEMSNSNNNSDIQPSRNITKPTPIKQDLKKKIKNKQKVNPNKQQQQMNKQPIVPKMINLQNEFSQLKQISNDQTKQANILFEQQNKSVNDYVINKYDTEPETTAEKLIELKQLERAPKLQPKYQQYIDEAKQSYYSTIQHEDQIKTQIKQEQIDQVINISQTKENNLPIQNAINTDNQANSNQQQKTQQMLEKQFKLLEEQIPSFDKSENHENNNKILLEMTHNSNLRSPLNSVTLNSPSIADEKLQQSSIELLEQFNHIENTKVEEIKQQSEIKPSEERFSRLHNYVEKAENTEINFLQKNIVEEPKIEEIKSEEENHIQVNDIPYSERLKQRKNEIMLELKQKYNIKTETNIQENSQLQMSSDLYPQILYEKELEEIKKTTALPKRKEKQDGTQYIYPIDTSYQLEAAYYEWTLHKE